MKKDEILEYLKQLKLNYRIDKTNFSSDYERNFLRNEIIPLLKRRLNPSIEDSIFNSSEVFKKISLRIDKEIEPFFNTVKFDKKKGLLTVFQEKLETLDKDLLSDFFKEIIKRNFFIQLSFNDINNIVSLLSSETGKKVYHYR